MLGHLIREDLYKLWYWQNTGEVCMPSGWGTSYKLTPDLCPLTEERTVSFISVFLLVGGRGSGIESGEARNEGFIFFLHLLLIKTLIGALPSTSSAPQTGVYICLGLRGHMLEDKKPSAVYSFYLKR